MKNNSFYFFYHKNIRTSLKIPQNTKNNPKSHLDTCLRVRMGYRGWHVCIRPRQALPRANLIRGHVVCASCISCGSSWTLACCMFAWPCVPYTWLALRTGYASNTSPTHTLTSFNPKSTPISPSSPSYSANHQHCPETVFFG